MKRLLALFALAGALAVAAAPALGNDVAQARDYFNTASNNTAAAARA